MNIGARHPNYWGARPAAPTMPLPRRVAAEYCKVCGNTGPHWHGCPQDEPVTP